MWLYFPNPLELRLSYEMDVKQVKFLVKASECSLKGIDYLGGGLFFFFFLHFTSFPYLAAWNANMMAGVSAAIMDHAMINFDEDLD